MSQRWRRVASRWHLATLLIIISGTIQTSLLHAQNQSRWRIKNRLQTSYEYDSNIRESISDSVDNITASSLRLLFDSRAAYAGKRWKIAFDYQGGLQSYINNPIENKLINEAGAQVAHGLGRFVIGARASGRLKVYLNDVFDYGRGSVELFGRLPPAAGFGNEVALQTSALRYENFERFDHSEYQVKWRSFRRLTPRLVGNLTLTARAIDFNRPRLLFNPPDSTITDDERKQSDLSFQLAAHISFSRRVLVEFGYAIERNASNSDIYTFWRHDFTARFGLPLGSGFWIRGLAAIQLKSYDSGGLMNLPQDADPERENSSFLIFDVSRDIRPSLTAIARIAYYNNESVLRSEFYQKFLITTGLDFRF